MSELVTKSAAQEQQEQETETQAAVERIGRFTIVATAMTVLAIFVATALFAQGQSAQSQNNDNYALVSRGRRLHSLRIG